MKTSLILLTVLSSLLVGCGTTAPKPNPVPRCGLLVNPNGSPPYLLCQDFDGEVVSGPKYRVPVADLSKVLPDGKPLHPEHFVCTTDLGYSYLEGVYAPQLQRYMTDHCQ